MLTRFISLKWFVEKKDSFPFSLVQRSTDLVPTGSQLSIHVRFGMVILRNEEDTLVAPLCMKKGEKEKKGEKIIWIKVDH